MSRSRHDYCHLYFIEKKADTERLSLAPVIQLENGRFDPSIVAPEPVPSTRTLGRECRDGEGEDLDLFRRQGHLD